MILIEYEITMTNVEMLVHAKWIITCNKDNEVFENHTLVVSGGKIIAIVPTAECEKNFQAPTIHNFPKHALLPGLINAHTHLAMNLFRGLADDLELMDWLKNYIWPTEQRWVSDEFVFDGASLAMAEMIRGGTTTFNDMFYFLESTAQAAELAGMRAHVGITVIDVPTAWAKTPEEYFAKGIAFYESYKKHPRITVTLAPHSTYMVSVDNLKKVKDLRDQLGLKINIHLQEDPAEIKLVGEKYQQRPVQLLNEIGLLSNQTIAIHMTQLNDADFELLRLHQPSIVHCPESNMKLAGGMCPVETLLREGINVALGTDGAASNNDLDMIAEMRSAAFFGKIVANDPKAVSAVNVLRMATINGAKALGIDHLTGSLEKNKAADFIAIDFNCVETQPLYNPVSQIVYATSRNQVTDVWVDGKQLLKNRELQTLDENALLAKADVWRNRIVKAL